MVGMIDRSLQKPQLLRLIAHHCVSMALANWIAAADHVIYGAMISNFTLRGYKTAFTSVERSFRSGRTVGDSSSLQQVFVYSYIISDGSIFFFRVVHLSIVVEECLLFAQFIQCAILLQHERHSLLKYL